MSHSTARMHRFCHLVSEKPKSNGAGTAASVATMTILVTGATGNIGRRIVDRLIDLGAPDIRALTNNPAKANLPDGVTAITGYLGRPESLPAALDGVGQMYLAPLPATLDVTLEMIAAAGVSYVVALSGGAHWQEHADKIALAPVVSTQLGPGEFCENFSVWAPQIAATGTVRTTPAAKIATCLTLSRNMFDRSGDAVQQPVDDLGGRQVDAAVLADVLPRDQQVVADQVQGVLHRPGAAELGDQRELDLDPVRLGVDQGAVHVDGKGHEVGRRCQQRSAQSSGL